MMRKLLGGLTLIVATSSAVAGSWGFDNFNWNPNFNWGSGPSWGNGPRGFSWGSGPDWNFGPTMGWGSGPHWGNSSPQWNNMYYWYNYSTPNGGYGPYPPPPAMGWQNGPSWSGSSMYFSPPDAPYPPPDYYVPHYRPLPRNYRPMHLPTPPSPPAFMREAPPEVMPPEAAPQPSVPPDNTTAPADTSNTNAATSAPSANPDNNSTTAAPATSTN